MDVRALVVLAFKVSILCTVFRIGLKAAIAVRSRVSSTRPGSLTVSSRPAERRRLAWY
jgi:hypothetical protein